MEPAHTELVGHSWSAPLRAHVVPGTLSRVSEMGAHWFAIGYRYALVCMAVLSALAILACLAARAHGTDDGARGSGT
ncbi:MAG: hypothetical protein ACRDOO_23670 [Actinomadura sp.]